MSELENRKRLLIAEGEVYRQTLKLEFQNLRIYGLKTKRKLTSFRGGNPVLAFGVPMITSFFARKRNGKSRRWGALAFVGWQLFNRVGSFFNRPPHVVYSRNRQTAAEEYLERKM